MFNASSFFRRRNIENESPILYYVDKEYLKYLHKEDYRVSVKFNNRPFAGIVTMVGGRKYIIPLTSQTTEERKNAGKNKRSSLITTFVTETSGKEISNLLYKMKRLLRHWKLTRKRIHMSLMKSDI